MAGSKPGPQLRPHGTRCGGISRESTAPRRGQGAGSHAPICGLQPCALGLTRRPRLWRVKLTFTHQAPWAGTQARKASCLCPYRGVTVKGHQWEEAGMAGPQAAEAESEKAAPKVHRTFTGPLTRVPPPSSPALAPRAKRSQGHVRPQSQGRPPHAAPTPGAAEGTSARSKSLHIASVHKEAQMGPRGGKGRKVWRAGRASGLCPSKWEAGGLCWTPVSPGDAQLSTAKDKGQSAEGPWAQSGPWAGSQTHLAVLRDLHLLPLRHLGDVEVALWDPQKRRHQEASEETRNALRNVCS